MQSLWQKLRRWPAGRRLPKRLGVLLLLAAILLVFHVPILTMLAWPLETAAGPESVDRFCLRGGEMGVDGFEPFQAAVAWHAAAPGRKILLMLPRASRVVEIGAVASFEETCRRELAARGVPAADVESIVAGARNPWEEAHALSAWMDSHPGLSVGIGCSPFAGGRLRYTFDAVLDRSQRGRLHLTPLPDTRYVAGNWWRTRTGVKDFMFAWLDRVFAWTQGDRSLPSRPGAAEFLDEMREKIGEAP